MPALKEYEAVPASDETVVASPSSSKITANDYDEEETRIGSYEEDEESITEDDDKPRRQHLEELNRPKTHRDRTKYNRRDKGFQKEAFFVSAA